MQKNSKSMKQFWKDNGYYILLGLCVAAVGISGYFFLNGALQEKEQVQPVLSIPATVEEPSTQRSDVPEKTAPAQTAPAEEAAAPSGSEPVLAEVPEVVMPVSGAVLQDHAMDRLVYHATTQDWRVHNGVDLAAEAGQTVRAARAGTVSAVYEDPYYGMTVVVLHEDGYTSHYCNLEQTALVGVGDTVTAGMPIGTVGSTALIETAVEPHLHFEVYRDGEPVDPAGFLY